MNTEDSHASLDAAFLALSNALASGDLPGFYGLMHGDALIIDEDIPFLGGLAEFKDHSDWHVSGIWTGFQWCPRTWNTLAANDSGVVTGYSTFRGKPVDAGYRQRHMFFSQGWTREAAGWRMVNWHQSTLDGHILDASPG